MSETVLTLNYGGFPPLSARGCVQTLTPLQTGEFRRTVNGNLVYTGNPEHRKYASTIQCKDKAPFAIEGLWRGAEVIVGCIQSLCQELKGDGLKTEMVLERMPVKGSLRLLDEDNNPFETKKIRDQKVSIKKAPARGKSVYAHYRPLLRMQITDFSLTVDEWGVSVGWRLDLEEI